MGRSRGGLDQQDTCGWSRSRGVLRAACSAAAARGWPFAVGELMAHESSSILGSNHARLAGLNGSVQP
jgi:hypothetical protein